MKIKSIYLMLLLLSSLLFSCEDQQEFKIPVGVEFFMDIKRNQVASSRLQLNDGYIILSSFDFEGEREQAEEVDFSREYEQGLHLPFSSNQPIEEFRFQLPQGNYTSISIEFETYEGNGENSLVVEGSFQYSDGTRYPLVLVLRSSETFKIEASSYSDGNQIIIKKEAYTSANIKLNPVHWFQDVPLALLEEAEISEWEGVPTIVISEEENEDIFDLVEDRLEEGAEAVFIY